MKGVTAGPWSFHAMCEPNEATECPNFTAYTVYIDSGDKLIAEVSAYAHREGFDDGGYPRVSTPEENLANATLIAEAGTVHHETGLSPRELLAQRDELVKALKAGLICLEAMARVRHLGKPNYTVPAGSPIGLARAALAKVRP